ncbi:MAG: DUF2281 domain-containing protein [Nostoc sp.]|uniref:DUF2281 domain-containing protein n=1 Tax=Nostoc sp. TaxID=1180 RepID=UPI002FF7F935
MQFLQAKHQTNSISSDSQSAQMLTTEHSLKGSTAEDLLEFVGSWEGSDIRECLQLVHDSRIPLEF